MRAFTFSKRSDVIESLKDSPKLRHLDLIESFYIHHSQAAFKCPTTLERLTLIGPPQLEMLKTWCSDQFAGMPKLTRLTIGVFARNVTSFQVRWRLPPNLETLSVMINEHTWRMSKNDSIGLSRFITEHAQAGLIDSLQLLEVFVVRDYTGDVRSVDGQWVKDSHYAMALGKLCCQHSILLNIDYIKCTFLSHLRSSLCRKQELNFPHQQSRVGYKNGLNDLYLGAFVAHVIDIESFP